MTREERMNEIFSSNKSEQEKIIEYQNVVIEELAEQGYRSNMLLLAALNKRIDPKEHGVTN